MIGDQIGPKLSLSIIIVNWNRSDLTLDCIKSVINNTNDVNYEIVIVDNGSDEYHIKNMKSVIFFENYNLIELNQNLYFGEANNIGVEFGSGEYIIFLNNDVKVSAGYLETLLSAMQTADAIGAVGPKFVYPDGRLQEAGAYVLPDGWTVQHGKAEPLISAIAGPGLHVVDYCSAACLLMRRDVFIDMGGFDPLYDPAYFEDVDLMLRLRSRGLFTYLCADVTVTHEENATSRSLWDQERILRLSAENHDKFMDRWGDYVSRRIFEDLEPPVFGSVGWHSEPADTAGMTEIVLAGPGLVRDIPEWMDLIRRAADTHSDDYVVFIADEACSRCRVYTLAARIGVRLGRFSIRRRDIPSDVDGLL